MAYWVYENAVVQKARVHRDDCSFCQSGRGIHGGGTRRSGRWFGPYSHLSQANEVAKSRKQPDTRACGVCIGGADAIPAPRTSGDEVRATPGDLDAHPWDESNVMECSLGVEWLPIGRVTIDGRGKLRFPRVSEVPGIYRFRTRLPDGSKANYIGETENLNRRLSQNYRNPGPTQQTNLRINAWLVKLLSNGGEVSVAVIGDAWVKTASGEQQADFSIKSVRRMFETFAIMMEHAEDIESLNR
jgi:hypothetical protein